MEVGKQIRALRQARGLSQGDIEKSSGLLRSYISRVEGGYTAPSLGTLEKFAKALGVEPYQLLFRGKGNAVSPRIPPQAGPSKSVRKLIKLFGRLGASDRKLLLTLAAKLSKE
jgi:transcriptional regulator with XRE-family HTH domain